MKEGERDLYIATHMLDKRNKYTAALAASHNDPLYRPQTKEHLWK